MIRKNIKALNFVYKASKGRLFLESIKIILNVMIPIVNLLFLQELLNSISERSIKDTFVLMIILYFITAILNVVFMNWYSGYYIPLSDIKIKEYMLNIMYDKIKETDIEFYDDVEFYQSFTRGLNECDSRLIEKLNILSRFAINLLSVVSIFTIIVSLDPIILSVSFITVFFSLFTSKKMNDEQYKYYMNTIIDERKLNYIKRVMYLKNYSEDLKMNNLYSFFFAKFKDLYATYFNKSSSFFKINKQYSLLQQVVSFVVTTCCLAYLVLKAVKGIIGVGEVTVLYNGTQVFAQNLNQLFMFYPDIIRNTKYMDSVFDFLSYESVIENQKGKVKLTDVIKELKIDNVSFSYNNPKKLLNSLYVELKQGETIAIFGRNGMGKTTLVKLLAGLYLPTQGQILINGVDMQKYDIRSIREKIAYIPQNINVYALSIAENILLRKCSTKEDETKVVEALEYVGLKEKVLTMPRGIYTEVTREFSDDGMLFSVGEIQKLAITRLMVSSAEVVILDEVTSNVDIIAENDFYSRIIKECKKLKKILIIISHKMFFAQEMDKILFLEGGGIVSFAKHEDLIKTNEMYKTMNELNYK